MADKTAIIKEAQKYLAKGQIDKAIAEWEKLVKEFPDGNVYNTIGDLYLKKGNKKSALESFHKSANFFRHEGFSLKALALYKKVLNIDPNDAEALYSLGELSEEKELVTDAIRYYLAAADSFSKAGKKENLIEIYGKILALSPSNIPLRMKIAEILLKEGLRSDAAREYLYLAQLYEEKGDLIKAKEAYQKTIDIQPLNKDAVIGISNLYEKTGEIENAIEQMREATILFHESPDVLLRYAELCLTGNKIENAKTTLLRLITLDSQNTKARRKLCEIWLKEGQKEKAWNEIFPVIDQILLEENTDEAIKFINIFREIEPEEIGKRLVSLYRQIGETSKLVDELIRLGDIFKERGMDDEAISYFKEALKIAPDNIYLHEQVYSTIEKQPAIETVPEISELMEEPAITEEGSLKSDYISEEREKTAEEIFSEADIFSKYGLIIEAQRLLEGLRMKDPENTELHLRLKAIYLEIGNKEAAVTECLILSELHKRLDDIENSDRFLREAFEINPDDPRLEGRISSMLIEPTSFAVREKKSPSVEEPSIEAYEEEIAEADFYARQGLTQEALKILERLIAIFPGNKHIVERLNYLGQGEAGELEEKTDVFELPESIELPDELRIQDSSMTPDLMPAPEVKIEEKIPEEKELPHPEKTTEETKEEEKFEDLILTEKDLLDVQEMPTPLLDQDVLDIFQEFKKGLEKELSEEDSETHYNLGIAYKEMGLIDDAIKEFQTSKGDPKRFIQSSTMLGVCYMEKGLYSLAIDVLSKALEQIKERDESYWAVKYDLAEAYANDNKPQDALKLFTEVYGWNAKFRNVAERLDQIKLLVAKGPQTEKPKERRSRVSYL